MATNKEVVAAQLTLEFPPFNITGATMARAATKTAPKKNIIKVDFTGVETASVIPEGEYIAEVTKCEKETGDSGNDYIAWELKVSDGKQSGKKLYNNTSLATQSLWATKRFLECLGIEVPDGTMDIDMDDMIGLQVGVVVEHDTWKGRTRSKVVDSYPAEGEAEGAEPEAEADAEGELPNEYAVNEMGKAELAECVKEHDLDVELEGTTAKQRRAVIAAIKEKAAEEPEPEPDAKPAGKGKAGTVAAKPGKKVIKIKADEVNEMDEGELAEIIEKHELDVDLDKLATTRRKRAAVIDALETAELLDETE
jgi:hypothetical protein